MSNWPCSFRPKPWSFSTRHTDELRCMVVAADRSPARYIFELKLAEVPSGPLNSKRVMLRTRSLPYLVRA